MSNRPDPGVLRADCARCQGLCCVAPAFVASSEFAFTKPARTPCRHLTADDRCAVHAELGSRGMGGCVAFDCLGAGQQVVAGAAGRHWRDDPDGALFDALEVLTGLHELLWYLDDAVGRAPALAAELDARRAEVLTLVELGISELGNRESGHRELAVERARTGSLLRRVCDVVRGSGGDRSGSDLAGGRFAGTTLRATCLRGSVLIGADLSGADLTSTDLLGVDLRGADLRGADLSGALFLTPGQVGAAVTDASTRLPARLGDLVGARA